MTPEDVLLKAIEVLETQGWCQDELVNEAGNVCAVGAVSVAAWGTPDVTDSPYLDDIRSCGVRSKAELGAITKLQRVIYGCRVPFWNDEPGRTAEDVILMFKKAAGE